MRLASIRPQMHAEGEFEKGRVAQDGLFEGDFAHVAAETKRLSDGVSKVGSRKKKDAMTSRKPPQTDDATQLSEFEVSARAEVPLPADAHVIGEPVTVT